ncbi:MAG: YaeQ family protein [Gemmatimonadaceae bacterium]|nr:YaeQ family protein [Gemmatimonadaceae bacterium]MCC6431961.1 YaeQ family protein [Gemmatimonadaceae bacterium]
MALTSTMYTFDITLSNVDRGVYETLALRAAMHPSESPEYFTARLFAYCLEYAEGIVFSKGVSDADEPTIAVRDLTGALQVWVEIGAPDAARLHKASKASPRVAVYTHRDPAQVQRQLAGERIHRAAEIPLYAIDRDLIAAFCERLDRRMKFSLSMTDGTVYLDHDGASLSGVVERMALQAE